MSNKKLHSNSTFQEEWLTNKKYKLWVAKTSSEISAKCILCVKEIDITKMGGSTLDSHATSKKHEQRVKERLQRLDTFFKRTSSEISKEPSESQASSSKSTSVDQLLINDNTLNAEILWTLKVVMSHFSFRSCIELNKLFQCMFTDSEIASNFTLGKTKCSYFINFGIAHFFKGSLKKQINLSPFYILYRMMRVLMQ